MSRHSKVLLGMAAVGLALLLTGSSYAADRIVRAQDMTVNRGETNRLYINFETLGDEYALGFTLCFNTNHLAYVGAVRGTAVSNTTPAPSFTLNANRATNGQVAILIGLDIFTEQTWPSGTHGIVEVLFRGVPGSGTTNTTVSFCSSITPTEVSSPQGEDLPATFVSANVSVVAPCFYALSTNSVSFGAAGQSGTVNVIASPGCTWALTNTNAWISITAGQSGAGNGVVAFDVEANGGSISRTGVVMIAGQPFTIVQAGLVCNYVLFSTQATHDYGADTNTIDVGADDGCPWQVINTNAWIEILTATNNTGGGQFSYAVSANPSGFMRSGVITVASQPFTVVQLGAPCVSEVSPLNPSFVATATNGQITVNMPTGCEWMATTSAEWITVPGGIFTSNAVISYGVAANSLITARTGIVMVADQMVQVVQAGAPCTFTLSATNRTHTADAATNSVDLVTLDGCAWTATTTNNWIILTQTSGSGSGVIGYELSANESLVARVGAITASGQTLVITQQAVTCLFNLDSFSSHHPTAGGSASVNVTAPTICPWTIENTNSWIQVTAGGNGTGNGVVTLQVQANAGAFARDASLRIAGHTYIVTQDGVGCSFSIAPTSATHGAGTHTASVTVTALPECGWGVTNTNSWITFNATTTTGVTYTVSANASITARTGTVIVAGQQFTVSQEASPCLYTLGATNATFTAAAQGGTVSLTTFDNCDWSVSTTTPWISIASALLNTNSGTVTFNLQANDTVMARSGTITIAGKEFTVNQLGTPCSAELQWSNWVHRSVSETGLVGVISNPECIWGVTNSNSWIRINSETGIGNGTVGYTVMANTTTDTRTGVLNIGGGLFTVTQLGVGCTYRVSPTNRIHGTSANSNSVTFTAGAGCSWAVINTNSWITILSNATGTGNATIGYGFTRNTAPSLRSGAINIGGEILFVTQWGTSCGFSVVPVGRSHGNALEIGSVTVNASSSGCAWNVVNTNTWISITAGPSGVGNGSFSYSITETNTTGQARSGTITVNGAVFTIVQAGVPCSFALSTNNVSFTSAADSSSVSVTTGSGCSWAVLNTNSWIAISTPLNNTNSGTVSFQVEENSTAIPRAGTVMIDGQALTITQAGAPCEFTLAADNVTYGYAPTNGLVSVSALTGCAWTVSNANNWIIFPTTNFSGSSTASYTVLTNSEITPRTGIVAIQDKLFTIVQAGAPCSFVLGTNLAAYSHAPANGAVAVAAPNGCVWPVSTTNSWINILSGPSGTNTGVMTYFVSTNSTIFARTGHVSVADQLITIVQQGTPCSFALSQTNVSHNAPQTAAWVTVHATPGCGWSVSNTNSWITIDSIDASTVNYTVSTNSGSVRVGFITIAGIPFRVIQAGSTRIVRASDMTITRGTTNRMFFTLESTGMENALGFSVCFDTNYLRFVQAVRGTASSNFNATLNVNTSGATNGEVGVTVALGFGQVFPAGLNGVVEIQFAGVPGITAENTAVGICDTPLEREISDEFGEALPAIYINANVTVLGACSFSLNSSSLNFSTNAGTDSIGLITHPTCEWTAWSGSPWIRVTSATNGFGTSSIQVQVDSNPGILRTGTVFIADQIVTIRQQGQPCTYTLSAGTNAHSFGANTGSVNVAVLAGCEWTVSNTDSWITFSLTNGVGSAEIFYTIISNSIAIARTGTVMIAQQPFRIEQAGAPCSPSLVGVTNKLHGYASETGSVALTITTGCDWTISNTNSWIVFTSGTSGSGNASISYLIGHNPNNIARTGTVMIATRPFTVRQPANPCPVTLAPASANIGASWATNSVTVTPGSACAWTAMNTNAWIILSNTNGTGSGSIGYVAQPNPFGVPRIGILVVSGREFVITQAAATCFITLTPAGRLHSAAGGNGSIRLDTTSSCPWSVENTNAWVNFSAPLSGSAGADLAYTVVPNPSSIGRAGNVVIGSQVFGISQEGVACSYALSFNDTNFSAAGQTGEVSVVTATACRWTATTSNSWIGLAVTNFTNSASMAFSVTPNPTGLTRTGYITLADKVLTVTQTGIPCVITISPTNSTIGSAARTNVVSVQAPIGCDWPQSSSGVSWITLVPPATTSGTGLVSYVVGVNPSSIARTGSVTIAGQTFTLTQFGAPCLFDLSATTMTHGPSEEEGTVTFSGPTGCPWTVSTTNSWIEIFSSVSGTDGGTLVYVTLPNPASLTRTGYVAVADKLLRITQAGQACTFTLSSSGITVSSVPETNTFSVNTPIGCPWSATTTNNWIQIITGATNSGNGLVRFAVSTNALATSRTGAVVVAGQPFLVVQQGAPCTYRLSITNDTLSSGNVTGLVSVVSTGGCTWAVIKTNEWIAIKAGAEGTNNGLVRYTLAANPSPSARVGNMLIAGHVFTVTQLGSPCNYTLSTTGRLHSSLLDTGQVSLITVAECDWTIENTNSWIQFPNGTNGIGAGVITYVIQPNPMAVDRVGRFLIRDQLYTVRQVGAECSLALQTYSAAHGGLSETGSISVVTPSGCSWSIVETNSWITMLTGLNHTNSTNVSYSVQMNVSGTTRVGVIRLGDAFFSVTQAPVACSYSLVVTNTNHHFEAETNFISVTTSNVCQWTITKTNPWINLISSASQTGNAIISYYVSANPSSSARTGTVVVAGQPVTVRQAGLVCTYEVTPTSRTHGFRAETNQVAVTCPSLCTWSVSETNSWITILTATGNTGPGTMRYALTQNPSSSPRTGTITVDGQAVTITQSGMPFILASNKTVLCNTVWDFDPPVSSGSCGVNGVSLFIDSTTTNYTCGSTYKATRVWDVTDMCGVSIMATQVVTVASPPPIMTCAPDKDIECGMPWTFNAPTAIDACSGASLNSSIRVVSTTTNTLGMCGNTFSVTRTWEVSDVCSNKTTCSQTVRIVDTTPPTVTCAPARTVECSSLWSFDVPTASDSCGTNVTISIQSTVTNGTAGCGFTAIRTWRVVDSCSNATTCTQTVYAVDTTAPTLSCPPPKTVECGTQWTFDTPAAVDNCAGTNVLLTVIGTTTNTANACGSAFTATRTWQVVDPCGNPNFCSQTVTVIDTTPPVVSVPLDKTVEFGVAWDFDAPTGVDGCGGTNISIRTLATSTNKSGFCGPSFIATRVWEIADGCSNKVTRVQIVTVRDTTPPVITCASNKIVNCQSPWIFDTPTAIDMPSGVAATIAIVSTETNGTCGEEFSVTRTWVATDQCGNSNTCSQTVVGRALVSVAGTVFVPTNFPASTSDKRVAGAIVLAPTNAVTAPDGTFVCTFEAGTNVALAPVAPPASTSADGVTTIDLSLVRRHILSVAPLDTPYKLLAGDVDGSGSISTLDLTSMRRVILGVTNRFPRGLWRFIPSTFTFTNAASPWNAPTNRVYSDVWSDMTGQDFIGIKLGDVNNSWNSSGGGSGGPSAGGPSKTETAGSSPVTFSVSNVTTLPGTNVVVRVSARNFRRVTSVQGTLTWDPSVVRFVAAEQFGLANLSSGNFGTNQAGAGSVSFSWDDPSTNTTTLSDGTTLFAVRFEVVGEVGSSSPVYLGNEIAAVEVGVEYSPVPFQTVDGGVAVFDPSTAHLRLATTSVAPGLTVQTVEGRTYTLEYTDALPGTNWTAISEVTGDGELKTITDPNPAMNQRFYRVRIE